MRAWWKGREHFAVAIAAGKEQQGALTTCENVKIS